ncbi:hypothetical protein GTZ89_22210 [Streptomyces sp. SID8382]|uniref:hypothetical protein n=1 Tax=Streptomyces malaysiensis TaxID=92644 RepID=UPI000C2BAA72|nr:MULTISPECIES: hypothetical protein [unclassified Streptomyces]AUA11260.1 hypothetical protein CFP59_03371 [Streptomyces sp. M56]MYX58302.1 hypothetical protein [Streptomyces sp. SID8382]
MNAWLLTCNQDVFDLASFRQDGHELQSWSVVRYRRELADGDRFVMWITGSKGGLIGRGRFTGPPTQQASSPDEYWQEDPGQRWYAPLVMDEWLDEPVPRSEFTEDPRFLGTSPFRMLFAGNPHRLSDDQWEAFNKAFEQRRTPGPPNWELRPGDTIPRGDLHGLYGGSRVGDISTCTESGNVLLFASPHTKHRQGCRNGWAEDGTFHYIGEGSDGDQDFASTNNTAIRDHTQEGLALRLFDGDGDVVRYVGEFAVDPSAPYDYADVPKPGGGSTRRVIRFHLLPVGIASQPASVPVGCEYRVADDTVEPAAAGPGPVNADLATRNLKAHRRLQNDLAAAARERGMTVLSPSAADPDFDLAWRRGDDDLVVCEVKSLTRTNEARQLRLGVGQLLDYYDLLRTRTANVRAVLWVEHEPSDSRWLGICHRAGIELAWPGREGDILV